MKEEREVTDTTPKLASLARGLSHPFLSCKCLQPFSYVERALTSMIQGFMVS